MKHSVVKFCTLYVNGCKFLPLVYTNVSNIWDVLHIKVQSDAVFEIKAVNVPRS